MPQICVNECCDNRLLFNRCWYRCPFEMFFDCVGYQFKRLPSYFYPCFNTLRPRQHGHHFPDDIFKCIFVNENVWVSIKVSLNIVPAGPINNIPALVQIMAWRRLGDKPLSELMIVLLLTHICVTRPQRVNPRQPTLTLKRLPYDHTKLGQVDITQWYVILISIIHSKGISILWAILY